MGRMGTFAQLIPMPIYKRGKDGTSRLELITTQSWEVETFSIHFTTQSWECKDLLNPHHNTNHGNVETFLIHIHNTHMQKQFNQPQSSS
ncbi:Uncharacterized protein TCM_024223 [Theobroma cacao]|uniref:Uncharacterized protein n=1 Tax=Theobroma cacao TaxID=3641 RepID=A0A061EV14_THECC|nr:Uncharacterized protein TCM_024223 [Theobroma cacao]